MSWWKKLLGGSDPPPGETFRAGNLALVQSSDSRDRAESALPGTAALAPILDLLPPQPDPDLVPPVAGTEKRDITPDPVAEVALNFPASRVFRCADLLSGRTKEMHEAWGRPMFYVVTPDGHMTYMIASNAPEEGRELIVGWQMYDGSGLTAESILEGARKLCAWLRDRPEGFDVTNPDPEAIEVQFGKAQMVINIRPIEISVMAFFAEEDRAFDGRQAWDTLHAMGLRWGDMDQFHWADPTGQTDYLFSAIVDDRQIGYALPEEIAACRQHFVTVEFTFNIARSPAPDHVLGQMIRAAGCFQQHTGCRLACLVDGQSVEGPDVLRDAVADVTRTLAALDLKPGSSTVCMLR
jgi:cell division protein ZipA